MEEQKKKVPDNHVLAVLGGSAETLSKELRRLGYDPVVFRGEEVAKIVDPVGERGGLLDTIIKRIQEHLSEERSFLEQYEAEARSGKQVIAVALDDPDQANAVREVLERHGAYNIRFFGRLAIHDLTPESNPTPSSEESPAKHEEA